MPLKNTHTQYGTIAKMLHWSMAVLILGMIAAGFIMHEMDVSPDKFRLYGLHKSFGMLVLALVTLRLFWRLTNVTPPLPGHLPWWQKLPAHASHLALYGLMIAMPLVGWMMSSAAGFSVSVFGLFTLPDLVAPNPSLLHDLKDTHELGAWMLLALIGVHVSAALYHHFWHRDAVLVRMLPFGKDI